MTFQIIIAAIALLFILEGFAPLVSPSLWRNMVRMMLRQSDKVLRITGLIFTIIGVILLLIVHYVF